MSGRPENVRTTNYIMMSLAHPKAKWTSHRSGKVTFLFSDILWWLNLSSCSWWCCVRPRYHCYHKRDIKTLRPRQNGHHFADDTFKYSLLNENVIISTKISLKFVLKGPINNIPALVQIMARRRPRFDAYNYDTGYCPILGCDIQGFQGMRFNVQYWPRWFQDFPAIW